jgi:hypothetical protein
MYLLRRTLLSKRLYSTKPWSYQEATAWQKAFNQQAIPKEHVSISFSRSSGPGGQNVNKGSFVPKKKKAFDPMSLLILFQSVQRLICDYRFQKLIGFLIMPKRS